MGKKKHLLSPNINSTPFDVKNIHNQAEESDVANSSIDLKESENKKNAFTVMMESRFKIIGANYEGKERLEELKSQSPDKEVLKKRKDFLEKWAEKKGKFFKKKDLAQEAYIERTLEKREGSLRNLLENQKPKAEKKSKIHKKSNYKSKSLSKHILESSLNDTRKIFKKMDKGLKEKKDTLNHFKLNKKSKNHLKNREKIKEKHFESEKTNSIKKELLKKVEKKHRNGKFFLETSNNDNDILKEKKINLNEKNKSNLYEYFNRSNESDDESVDVINVTTDNVKIEYEEILNESFEDFEIHKINKLKTPNLSENNKKLKKGRGRPRKTIDVNDNLKNEVNNFENKTSSYNKKLNKNFEKNQNNELETMKNIERNNFLKRNLELKKRNETNKSNIYEYFNRSNEFDDESVGEIVVSEVKNENILKEPFKKNESKTINLNENSKKIKRGRGRPRKTIDGNDDDLKNTVKSNDLIDNKVKRKRTLINYYSDKDINVEISLKKRKLDKKKLTSRRDKKLSRSKNIFASEVGYSDNEPDLVFKDIEESSLESIHLPSSNSISLEVLDEIDLTNDEESQNSKLNLKKDVKFAPIFLKKLKPDKAWLEARKVFLESGIPESLTKIINKIKVFEDIEYDIFPTISHVQQKHNLDENETKYWNLSKIKNFKLIDHDLNNLIEVENYFKDSLNYQLCCKARTNEISTFLKNPIEDINEKIIYLKSLYPDFPVKRIFKILKNRNERLVKNSKSNESNNPKSLLLDLMWTEKYKMNSAEEIIGNIKVTTSLKQWLETWVDYNNGVVKQNKNEDSSGSEFCYDSDSRESMNNRMPKNIVCLIGPCGSGKTSVVYALCNELNINILEINASARRNGKKLSNDLQEATQSYQILNNRKEFFEEISSDLMRTNNENKFKIAKSESKKNKFSLILIEDIDIVFDEQDDGFITALNTLISTSKRPIILTSSDPFSITVKKFTSQYLTYIFKPFKKHLPPWLQLITLAEGIFVDELTVSNIIRFNNFDARRALLFLQFFILSGGPKKFNCHCNNEIESLVPFKMNFDYLTYIWNLSSKILFNQKINDDNIRRQKIDDQNDLKNCQTSLKISNQIVNKVNFENKIDDTIKINDLMRNSQNDDFKTMLEFYEDLSYCDVIKTRSKRRNKNCKEIDCNFWNDKFVNIIDGLSLEENYDYFSKSNESLDEYTTFLMNLNRLKTHFKFRDFDLNESFKDQNWHQDRFKFENSLLDVISPLEHLDHRAIGLDYFSNLREICRIEQDRALNSNKRRNRFSHYLKWHNYLNDINILNKVNEIFS